MTHTELEAHLTIIREFIKKERRMRQKVFVNRPGELAEKMAEIDNAIKSITEIVNALKAHMPQQAKLVDAPPRQEGC